MKKFTLSLLILALFSGCTLNHSNQQSKSFTKTWGDTSCVAYEVLDEDQNIIDLPSHIKESLSCATGAVQLSPNGEYLLYDYKNSLNLYNFENEDRPLFALEDDLEGISCLWHDSGEKIACALINQQKYEGGTKFVIIRLDGDIKEYFITEEEKADFVCGASCYPGSFWFENEDLIMYEGHNITAPGKVFKINLN